MEIGDNREIYPLIKGRFYLINKRKNVLVYHREIRGTGAVIDTAIDDFAKKVALGFCDALEKVKP